MNQEHDTKPINPSTFPRGKELHEKDLNPPSIPGEKSQSVQKGAGIKEQVLDAIKSGATKMRPKWHFILEQTLFVIGGVMLLLVILYLVSFIVFTLRQTGAWFGPLFGVRGWFVLFRSLPWVLILFSLFFIVILEVLVRRYSFSYRKPLLYSVLGILFIVIVGGGLAAPWHGGAMRAARENRLPPFAGGFYRSFGMQRFPDVRRGEIIEITPAGFVMDTVRGTTSSVVITSETRVPMGVEFKQGDTVAVFGNENEEQNEIQAYGVQEIQE